MKAEQGSHGRAPEKMQAEQGSHGRAPEKMQAEAAVDAARPTVTTDPSGRPLSQQGTPSCLP